MTTTRLIQAARLALTAIVCAGLVSVSVAHAAEERVEVGFEDGLYTVVIERSFNAPIAAVFHVITDYDNLEALDKHILESRRLEQTGDNTYLVYTRLRDCIAIFCKTIERVEEVHVLSMNEIVSTTDPERSDVEYGVNRWVLEETDDGTHLRYELSMKPDFWVPRFIGRAAVKRHLLKMSVNTLEEIERLAQAHEQDGISP